MTHIPMMIRIALYVLDGWVDSCMLRRVVFRQNNALLVFARCVCFLTVVLMYWRRLAFCAVLQINHLQKIF